jgi:hypothetical protein
MAITTARLLQSWTQTESGGSGTWLWVQRIGDLLKPEDLVDVGGELPIISMNSKSTAAPTYLFIEIVDMVDACGRDMLDQLDLSGEVYLVEPSRYSARDLNSAFQSCGWEGIKDVIEEFVETSNETQPNRAAIPDIGLLYADFLRSYGNKSPLYSASGGRIVTEKNMHDGVDERRVYALLRELLVEANQYIADTTVLQATLDTKVVNKMGQTSREFAGGIDSTWDTLRRIQGMGDKATPAQKLVLKMYTNAGQTLGGDKVPLDIVANEPLLRGQP